MIDTFENNFKNKPHINKLKGELLAGFWQILLLFQYLMFWNDIYAFLSFLDIYLALIHLWRYIWHMCNERMAKT